MMTALYNLVSRISNLIHPTPVEEPITGKSGQGCAVENGSLKPHKLSRTASSTTSSPVFCKAGMQHDHTAAVRQYNCSDLHKQDGRDPLTIAMQLTHSIVGIEPGKKIFASAEHLPGKENMIADEESRTVRHRCNWMLNCGVFNLIQARMSPCHINLFASHLTRQLPTFFSWRPDPEAKKTGTFNQDWSATKGYADPPWYLIGCCLSQIKQQNAGVILITPL